jgi:hypothetical protein
LCGKLTDGRLGNFRQSDDCRGIQNNYEVRGEDRKRAYNGMNHQIHERGELGFDEGELVGPFSFEEINAMRQACPDYQSPH